MIKLIVGNKGSGKTKTLISMANEAAKTTNGNVVFIEKGLKLTYDVSHQARLVDVEHYGISGFECYYGFLCGLLAGNYDITHIFSDSTLSIGGRDTAAFAAMIEKLAPLADENNVTMTFSVSCAMDEIPEGIKKFAI